MTLGMSTTAFTTLNVISSLVGIFSGVVVVLGMCNGQRLPRWTVICLKDFPARTVRAVV
jgi:hypothetical protein